MVILQVPIPKGAAFEVPRMNKVEWQAMARWYSLQVRFNITLEAFFIVSGYQQPVMNHLDPPAELERRPVAGQSRASLLYDRRQPEGVPETRGFIHSLRPARAGRCLRMPSGAALGSRLVTGFAFEVLGP